jgi:hypothetical protein
VVPGHTACQEIGPHLRSKVVGADYYQGIFYLQQESAFKVNCVFRLCAAAHSRNDFAKSGTESPCNHWLSFSSVLQVNTGYVQTTGENRGATGSGFSFQWWVIGRERNRIAKGFAPSPCTLEPAEEYRRKHEFRDGEYDAARSVV